MAYSDLQMRAFTQVAYMDLDKRFTDYCIVESVEKVPIVNLIDEDEKEKLYNLGISKEELETWVLAGVHDTNVENGFYACVIETGDEEAVVAFRGSEGSDLVNDWVEADLGLLNSTATNQHREIDAFLQKYQPALDEYENLALTGHSLGGNLAEFAAIVSVDYELADNVTQCISFDGPGFSDEFLELYAPQIAKMSGKMVHYRWSLVGDLLDDLPGVRYQYVAISNEANMVDENPVEYNALTRHDTKYLVFDENGMLVTDNVEQDTLSKIVSVISKGADHMPDVWGNILIGVTGNLLIGVAWAKEEMFDENGNLTSTGAGIIMGVLGVLTLAGGGNPFMGAINVLAVAIGVVAVTIVGEFIYEGMQVVANYMSDFLEDVFGFDVVAAAKKIVMDAIDSVKDWYNRNFNAGYRYASSNTYIKVDTAKLYAYARQLRNVNSQLDNLDNDLNRLYGKVALEDLWTLIKADAATSYSWRINRAIKYLENTAKEFENVERSLANMVRG